MHEQHLNLAMNLSPARVMVIMGVANCLRLLVSMRERKIPLIPILMRIGGVNIRAFFQMNGSEVDNTSFFESHRMGFSEQEHCRDSEKDGLSHEHRCSIGRH